MCKVKNLGWEYDGREIRLENAVLYKISWDESPQAVQFFS